MSSPDYVWEQMYGAVRALCGEGAFVTRLANATVSSLIRLEDNDLPAETELSADLKYILDWTKRNVRGGKLVKEPDELERSKLVNKIIHLLLELHEFTFRSS